MSLCMIVRDEASMLPAFLAAVEGVWDELVAVDTGSRDETPRILQAAGARVLSRQWQDDFAAARNVSLEAAQGDWVLVLDADERLHRADVQSLLDVIGDAGAGAATVSMRNVQASGLVRESRLLRLFRRHPDVRFQHRIHEDVWEPVRGRLRATGQRLVHADVAVDHLGYARSVAEERKKKDRDWRLLGLLIAEAPDDLYSHFKRLELARYWRDSDQWREAAFAANAAMERCGPDAVRALHVADELAVLVAMAPGGPHAAAPLPWLRQATQGIPDSACALYWIGHLLETAGKPVEAGEAFTRARACEESRDPQYTLVRPTLGLARVTLARGRAAEALALARSAFEAAPGDAEALSMTLLCARMSGGKVGEVAAGMVERLGGTAEARATVARAATGVGLLAVAAEILKGEATPVKPA